MKPLFQFLSRILQGALAFIFGLLIAAQFTAAFEIDPSILESIHRNDYSQQSILDQEMPSQQGSLLQKLNLYPYWLTLRSKVAKGVATTKTDQFQIQGEIKDLPNFSLVAIYDMDNQEIVARSFAFRGKFKLAGDVQEPAMGLLIVKKKYYKTIIIEPGEKTILANSYKELDEAIVKGGREQDLFNELEKLSYPLSSMLKPVRDSIINRKYKNKEDLQRLLKKHAFLSNFQSTINIKFGIENFDSHYGLHLVYHD
ncbi:MAG: DUF4369 domain-containing protein, partial [Bacteroidota bacterium]